MKALLWKDFRLNTVVLVVAAGLLLGPYFATILSEIHETWPAWPDQIGWARQLYQASFWSLQFSGLTLALLGGNSIACERLDRSAEFLAALPPSRALILASKLSVVLLTLLVIWGVDLLFGDVIAPLLSSKVLNIWDLPSRWYLLSGALVFGAAWLGSSFMESPTFATTMGIAIPLLLAALLAVVRLFTDWPDQKDFAYYFNLISCLLGIVCFAAGSWYYLQRVEP